MLSPSDSHPNVLKGPHKGMQIIWRCSSLWTLCTHFSEVSKAVKILGLELETS